MFGNLKIGQRLTLAFSIALLGLVIVGVVGVTNMLAINSNILMLGHDRFPKVTWAQNIIDAANEGARIYRNYALTQDLTVRQTELERLSRASKKALQYYDSLKRTVTTPEGIAILEKFIDIRSNQYAPARTKFFAMVDSGDQAGAVALLFGELRTAQTAYMNTIKEMIDYQTKLVNDEVAAAEDTYSQALTLIILVALLIILITAYFAYTIRKGIVTPLGTLTQRITQLENADLAGLGDGLTRISRGDLSMSVSKTTQPMNLDLKDEIGDLSRVVDKMIVKTQGGMDSYEIMRERLTLLAGELKEIITNANDGKLDYRSKTEKHEGVYRELISGVNEILESITKPILDGLAVLEKMATGDLTVRITADYKNQLQGLKNAINALGDSMGQILRDVSDAVAATASASSQISSSTEELAAGAQEQSAQASEVASAINEMTSTILQTANYASTAAESAKHAGTIANEGGSSVQASIQGMGRISDVVLRAAETVQKLGKGSEQIGEIIQVIDDIADQTNLLALNAAIEAARAGEQGRGFAVVADEVRKLAERTTKATKEIATMIRTIQLDTEEAVVSMNEGTKEVEIGKNLAVQSGKSLGDIVKAANSVVDVVTQVAAASEEQSSAAEQITKNIESISTVTHESAAGTQQIARAAEDLNRLTENLQRLIAQFKIDDRYTGTGRQQLRGSGRTKMLQ